MVRYSRAHGVLQAGEGGAQDDPKSSGPIKALIEDSPSVDYRTATNLSDPNKNTVQRIFLIKV